MIAEILYIILMGIGGFITGYALGRIVRHFNK